MKTIIATIALAIGFLSGVYYASDKPHQELTQSVRVAFTQIYDAGVSDGLAEKYDNIGLVKLTVNDIESLI